MDGERIRVATHDDVDGAATLAARRRGDYEAQLPRFWRQAEDAVARHTSYLHELVDDPDHVFLVAVDHVDYPGGVRGFVIGRLVPAPPVYEPGGPTCLVDDFTVDEADAWPSLGLALLREVSHLAREKGAVQVVVVSGHHDQPKRQALDSAGLVPATEWWLGGL